MRLSSPCHGFQVYLEGREWEPKGEFMKTWEEFEESFKTCPECEQPRTGFAGLFCRAHRILFQKLYELLGYLQVK
jgi:hypothetical protein